VRSKDFDSELLRCSRGTFIRNIGFSGTQAALSDVIVIEIKVVLVQSKHQT